MLLEVNRMLRGGGYFVWAAQPVYKHEKALEEQWEGIINASFFTNLLELLDSRIDCYGHSSDLSWCLSKFASGASSFS